MFYLFHPRCLSILLLLLISLCPNTQKHTSNDTEDATIVNKRCNWIGIYWLRNIGMTHPEHVFVNNIRQTSVVHTHKWVKFLSHLFPLFSLKIYLVWREREIEGGKANYSHPACIFMNEYGSMDWIAASQQFSLTRPHVAACYRLIDTYMLVSVCSTGCMTE